MEPRNGFEWTGNFSPVLTVESPLSTFGPDTSRCCTAFVVVVFLYSPDVEVHSGGIIFKDSMSGL
jgi:hypothetical protein